MLMKNYGTLKGANIHHLEDVRANAKDMNFGKTERKFRICRTKKMIFQELEVARWQEKVSYKSLSF